MSQLASCERESQRTLPLLSIFFFLTNYHHHTLLNVTPYGSYTCQFQSPVWAQYRGIVTSPIWSLGFTFPAIP